VNGDPSLMVTVKLATTAPSGVVSGIVRLLGVMAITGTAGVGGGGGSGGGGGGGGGAAIATLMAHVADPLNGVLFPIARTRAE